MSGQGLSATARFAGIRPNSSPGSRPSRPTGYATAPQFRRPTPDPPCRRPSKAHARSPVVRAGTRQQPTPSARADAGYPAPKSATRPSAFHATRPLPVLEGLVGLVRIARAGRHGERMVLVRLGGIQQLAGFLGGHLARRTWAVRAQWRGGFLAGGLALLLLGLALSLW